MLQCNKHDTKMNFKITKCSFNSIAEILKISSGHKVLKNLENKGAFLKTHIGFQKKKKVFYTWIQ